jgi:hypothetical protein
MDATLREDVHSQVRSPSKMLGLEVFSKIAYNDSRIPYLRILDSVPDQSCVYLFLDSTELVAGDRPLIDP